MKKVFISRDLDAKHPIAKEIHSKGYELFAEALIELKSTPPDVLPDTDWVFFYSQNGVQFFFDAFKLVDPKIKFGVIGEKTAERMNALGRKVNFAGHGDPEQTARSFLKLAEGQRVVFARAANSKASVQQSLSDKIESIDLVLYLNEVKTTFDLPELDILVFTSPLNVQAYFSKYTIRKTQKFIAIGKTTAKALHQKGVDIVYIPSSVSLEKAIASL